MAPRSVIRYLDIRPETRDLSSPGFSANTEDDFARGRYFHADCLAGDSVGDFVHIVGDDVSDIFQVEKVDITDSATMPAIGLILTKDTATRCFVLTFGILEATGLTPGVRYWVGTNSQITSTIPLPVSGTAVIQVIGHALSDTELLIRPEGQGIKVRS